MWQQMAFLVPEPQPSAVHVAFRPSQGMKNGHSLAAGTVRVPGSHRRLRKGLVVLSLVESARKPCKQKQVLPLVRFAEHQEAN